MVGSRFLFLAQKRLQTDLIENCHTMQLPKFQVGFHRGLGVIHCREGASWKQADKKC